MSNSEYSLLEGAVPVKKFDRRLRKDAYARRALTDNQRHVRALEFSVTAMGAGVQPIVGCQMALTFENSARATAPRARHPSCCWRRTRWVYANLLKLNTCLYIGKAGQVPQVTPAELAAHARA